MVTRVRTDEDIKADIVEQLRWDNRVDASKVSVMVDRGHVTLSGTVSTYSALQAARADALLVRGVRSIANQLQVKYTENQQIPSDRELLSHLLDTLRWDPELDADEIDVLVADGWVTLRGTVTAFWKKQYTVQKVSSLLGVRGVTNELAVVLSTLVTDRLIAEDIVDALARDMRVNVDDITVSVREGKVTLLGTVPNSSARAAAYNAALYTAGVVSINNNIVVG